MTVTPGITLDQQVIDRNAEMDAKLGAIVHAPALFDALKRLCIASHAMIVAPPADDRAVRLAWNQALYAADLIVVKARKAP